MLARLKGRFIMTLNDVPAVRQTFAAFRLTPVKLTYSLAGNDNAKRARELIITGRAARAARSDMR